MYLFSTIKSLSSQMKVFLKVLEKRIIETRVSTMRGIICFLTEYFRFISNFSLLYSIVYLRRAS